MIIDVHCHYSFSRLEADAAIERFSFEPARVDGAPALDSYLSPRSINRLSFRVFRWLLGIPGNIPPGPPLDARLAEIYDAHLLAPGPIERYVLLAFDAYRDRHGRLTPQPAYPSAAGGDLYTSNSLVRAACRKNPERFLFGASVHPYRPDAVAAVREVFAGGACLLKWLPLHQNIDIEDPRTIDVLRCCAQIGLPILVHYNAEFTLSTNHPGLVPIAPLLGVLRRLRSEGAMPTTIVAHVATPVTSWGDWEPYEQLLEAMTGEFADAPLYADISALTTPGKIRFFRQMAARQDLHHRLLFGTDFPVPAALWRIRDLLRREYKPTLANPSWPQRVALACRCAGFNDVTFHRASMVLPNLQAFSAGATR